MALNRRGFLGALASVFAAGVMDLERVVAPHAVGSNTAAAPASQEVTAYVSCASYLLAIEWTRCKEIEGVYE